MNEQELRERMQTSVQTAFAPDAIDPAADVTRGRRGLRRRRVAGGLTAAAAVAAVAALGAQYLPVSSAEPPVAQATSRSTSEDDARYQARLKYLGAQTVFTLHRHLGKSQKYLDGTAGRSAGVRGDGNQVDEFTVMQEWKQSGGTGLLWVSIARPRQALAKEKWCGPGYTPDLLRMGCFDRLAPNGRKVTIGAILPIKNSQGVTYRESGGQFVRYVRPDGQVVIAAVVGMNTLKRVADGLPKGVKRPDVTWPQLAAIATDPDLTLGK
ncbi:hypothetical protein ACI2LF_05815 [Kribbella sp. NPDC020789]